MIKERLDGLKRELHLFDGSALVVCSVIGSGIFLVPSVVAHQIQEPGLLLWVMNAGSIATLAVAFSLYSRYLFPFGTIVQKLIAVCCVGVLTLISYRGIRFNATVQNIFAFLKIGA